ncbi:MAG TPA: hypothetical protein VIV14_09725 [Gammaproteobacteria bacterium]
MSYRWLPLALVLAIGAGCGAQDDETAVLRQLIDDAEVAAEDRRTGYFRSLLAESYTDARGNDHERMIEIVRGYFLMHPSLEIVTRIDTIEIVGTDVAEISLLAGVVGQRVGGTLLGGLDGRLYALDLELVRQGDDWQIIGASWERALDGWDGGELPAPN